jgi:hypothetical protein
MVAATGKSSELNCDAAAQNSVEPKTSAAYRPARPPNTRRPV